MKYLSVCAGIEAATVAWHDLGWQPAAFSEIEPFPSAVLKHHYPNVPNVGDMTKFKEWDIGTIDLLVGGTPCQSFSVAGLRKGLDDPRGNLMLTYLAIAAKYQPRWLVWENVPGVLSSNGGKDFGTFLGALGEIGYGFAYRVLDAQYFGVAQRRRRVFVVGCLGDWRAAAAVLFERESLSGNPAPSREKREEVAKCITTGIAQRFDAETETMIPSYVGNAEGGAKEVPFLTCHNIGGTAGISNQTPLVNHPIALAENTIGRQPMNGGNGDGFTVAGPMYTLNASGVHGVAQPMVLMDQGGSVMNVMEDETVGTLRRETHGHEPVVMQPIGFTRCDHGGDAVMDGTPTMRCGSNYSAHLAAAIPNMAVRRLTPVECERLQGFPDTYTAIPWRKKGATECPDGPRYKALGNSMAVPVMRWIGKRIQSINNLKKH